MNQFKTEDQCWWFDSGDGRFHINDLKIRSSASWQTGFFDDRYHTKREALEALSKRLKEMLDHVD